MDGIIFDIKRFALYDGPGIRTTIFFKGCPLRCFWCHNPESMELIPQCFKKNIKLNGKKFTEEEIIGYKISSNDLMAELLKEQVFMQESGGGITFSGGEPLLQHEFLLEVLKLCKEHGYSTIIDTSLFSPWEIVSKLLLFTDIFLVDLKLINDADHKKYTGVSNKLILNNLIRLSSEGKSFHIRIPMIPGITMTQNNISGIISFLKQINDISSVDLLPFNKAGIAKHNRFGSPEKFRTIQESSDNQINKVKLQFEKEGFRINIGG